MRGKPSEWIAISDLMAGVMAVVMLLLVVAVLQKEIGELRLKEELMRIGEGKNDPLIKITSALQEMLSDRNFKELMAIDLHGKRLILRDGVFERGSACLTLEAQSAVSMVQGQLVKFLFDNPNARILVEGYTDNLPVKNPVIDYQRFCTVYDDNFTLSAARAREARKALVGDIDASVARRVVVAGYGDSRPLPGIDPSDSKNRRVEVQFMVE